MPDVLLWLYIKGKTNILTNSSWKNVHKLQLFETARCEKKVTDDVTCTIIGVTTLCPGLTSAEPLSFECGKDPASQYPGSHVVWGREANDTSLLSSQRSLPPRAPCNAPDSPDVKGLASQHQDEDAACRLGKRVSCHKLTDPYHGPMLWACLDMPESRSVPS